MAARYLDPTNDVAFKKVFSDKERLKDFLNAILRLPEGLKIIEIDFLSQEEIPDLGQGKRSLFDLKCKDQSGKQYVVEMQNRREKPFLKRVQYYASHTYVSQLPIGKSHEDLMPVIVVAISKYNLFPKEIEYISCHLTKEEKTNTQHLFELSYVFIELSKFQKTAEELNSIEDYWVYFLSKSQTIKEPPSTIKDALVLQAYKTVEQFNWTGVEYDAYVRSRLLAEAEEINIVDSFEKGVKKGMEQGLEKGIEQGIEQGIEKVARAMLLKSRPIEEIADITGLTLDQIKNLNS